jgi:hypothetical protein
VDLNLTDQSLIRFLHSSDTREKLGVQVHEVFIDFKKTYDSVRREVLYKTLIEFGIPSKLFRVIKMCLNKINSKVCMFTFHNDLKHYYNFSAFLQNTLVEATTWLSLQALTIAHTVRKVQQSHVELKLNRAHQLLLYADDVNLLEDNRNTIYINTETLINASKEVDLEVNMGR